MLHASKLMQTIDMVLRTNEVVYICFIKYVSNVFVCGGASGLLAALGTKIIKCWCYDVSDVPLYLETRKWSLKLD